MTIKLEDGKSYRRKNGDVRTVRETCEIMPFIDMEGDTYAWDGRWSTSGMNWHDLIAEVPAGTVMVPMVEGGYAWARQKWEMGEIIQRQHPDGDWYIPLFSDHEGIYRIKPEPKTVGWKEAEAWMDGGNYCQCGDVYKVLNGDLMFWSKCRQRWMLVEAPYCDITQSEYVLLDKIPAEIQDEQQ